MPGPLEGIRVIDMTQVIAGPLACMLLSDLGADVVKVEPPEFGDLTRLAQFAKGGLNSSVVNNNRGKQSIQVDIQQDAGRDLVLDLIKDADVVVYDGDPFQPLTDIGHLFIGGEEVPLRSRQTDLFERYRKK